MRTLCIAVFVLFACASLAAASARGPRPIGCGSQGASMRLEEADVPPDERPGIQNCTESWFTQTIDHFGFTQPPGDSFTFQQRYYVCDDYWRRANETHGNGPIFFYTGNEADVTLYINNTGLMWQSAPEFGALLIFAEHRYYGQSLPFGSDSNDHLEYLSSEQALADYAQMIYTLKKAWDCEDSAVIGFGGSYGGMLASWMRMKYPSALDGAIAASAPIMAFAGENPQTREEAYYRIVTRDASPIAQASEMCTTNVQSSWDVCPCPLLLFPLPVFLHTLFALLYALFVCPPLCHLSNQLDESVSFSLLSLSRYLSISFSSSSVSSSSPHSMCHSLPVHDSLPASRCLLPWRMVVLP